MLDFFGEYWHIIKPHLRSILFFFIGVNFVALVSFMVTFSSHTNYVDTQLTNYIERHQEIDIKRLCIISNCTTVKTLGKVETTYKVDENKDVHKVADHNYNFIKIHGVLYIADYSHFSIYNKTSNSHYILDTERVISAMITVMEFIIPLSLLIFIIPLLSTIRNEKNSAMLLLAGNEALLSNKSMINIAENIHHELNTPLEVIDNKIEKIHRILIKQIMNNDCRDAIDMTNDCTSCDSVNLIIDKKEEKLAKLEGDFDFIKTSSEQIYNVLEKMKSFKHLRYSNGNKTIKDIIDGGFKIINISNTNFDYSVDVRLVNYGMDGTILKNADLLSIILNHIKNSLEANASKIYILFIGFDKNKLKIRIVDNGNGIPQDAIKNIFKPNFTTKATDFEIRGNGMYLNKHILNMAGGEIRLIESTKKGTTLELSIPAKSRD